MQQWPAQQGAMQPAMQPYMAQPQMFQPMPGFAQQAWPQTSPMPGPPPQQPPHQPYMAPMQPQQQQFQQQYQPEVAQQMASPAASKAGPWWQNNQPEGGWKAKPAAWKESSWKAEDKNSWKQDDKDVPKKQWWKPAEEPTKPAVEPQKFKGKTFHWCPACYQKLYVGMHICLNRDCIHFVVT